MTSLHGFQHFKLAVSRDFWNILDLIEPWALGSLVTVEVSFANKFEFAMIFEFQVRTFLTSYPEQRMFNKSAFIG